MHEGDEVQVRVESKVTNGIHAPLTELDKAIYAMTHRTPEQKAAARARAMELYKPERVPPPGMTVWDVVRGQWPGDETDEQIDAALRDLS